MCEEVDLRNTAIWRPTVDDLSNMGFHGLISLECAAGRHGICTFPGETVLQLLIPGGESDIIVDGIVYTQFVDDVNLEGAELMSPNIYLASPEQAIVDMIRYDRPEEYILQALDNELTEGLVYGEPLVNRDRLNALAERYGVLDQLNEYRTHVSELWEE